MLGFETVAKFLIQVKIYADSLFAHFRSQFLSIHEEMLFTASTSSSKNILGSWIYHPFRYFPIQMIKLWQIPRIRCAVSCIPVRFSSLKWIPPSCSSDPAFLHERMSCLWHSLSALITTGFMTFDVLPLSIARAADKVLSLIFFKGLFLWVSGSRAARGSAK